MFWSFTDTFLGSKEQITRNLQMIILLIAVKIEKLLAFITVFSLRQKNKNTHFQVFELHTTIEIEKDSQI